jgi:hypothetical protein
VRSKDSVPAEIDSDLLELIAATLSVGDIVPTVSEGNPNRIDSIEPLSIGVTTERSARRRKAEQVPGWMFNVAWRRLQETGRVRRKELTEVKRSSAVCAILARLPDIEITSSRPVELALRARR